MSPIRMDFAQAPWRKSSFSVGQNSDCVEVAPVAGAVGVRDSKRRAAGALAVSRAAWRAFVADVARR